MEVSRIREASFLCKNEDFLHFFLEKFGHVK